MRNQSGSVAVQKLPWGLLIAVCLSAACGGGDGPAALPLDAGGSSTADSSQGVPTADALGPPLEDGSSFTDGTAVGPPGDDSSPPNNTVTDSALAVDVPAPPSEGSAAPDEASTGDAPTGAGDATMIPSADGGAPYSPCSVKTTPCVIMPVGDSITEGFRSSDHGGYRSELFHLALVDKKNITFVGSATPFGPNTVDNVAFPKNNDGHGGFRIDQIQALIVASLTSNKPNLVTLMIGTNDVNQQFDLANAPSRLGTLIDTILAQDARLVLFVATIIPTTDDTLNARVQAYNAAIPALVKARADAGKHVVLVDMYATFFATPNYKTVLMRGGTSDTLHPLEAGYQLMGQVWYTAAKSLLP